MAKEKIILFSRSYQNKLFPLLGSDFYESIHVTLTKQEADNLSIKGIHVEYCFETYVAKTDINANNQLLTSFKSDRFLNKYNHQKRLEILLKEVSFWSEIFDKYKPIAVLNELVAIEIAEVMYIEARKRGIRYLAWMCCPVRGLFYWIDDPICLSLKAATFQKEPSKASIAVATEYFSDIIYKQKKPFYILPFENVMKIRQLISASKGILKLAIGRTKKEHNFYESHGDAYMLFFERAFKSLFPNYSTLEEIDSQEIVLYPLHYEPEASLYYLSEFFSNQCALIENIIKCIRSEQVLVVKEHPAQAGMLLTSKFQRLLRENSQLLYLPSTISSFEVIKKSKLVITLTSHLGWEALIMGKPVYLLGKTFYDKYDYVNKFSSYEQLRDEIRSERYIYPNNEALLLYAAQLVERSFVGNPFPHDKLYDKKNLSLIVEAICTELSLREGELVK